MVFRLKNIDIKTKLSAKPRNWNYDFSPLTQTQTELPEGVVLPGDDSDEWKYEVVDGKKQRVYDVPGTSSDQSGDITLPGYEESYSKLTPKQKEEYPTIEIWEDYVKDFNKSKNPGVTVTQEASEYEIPVPWRVQNRANYRGRTGRGKEMEYNKDLDYNWENRYLSGTYMDEDRTKGYTLNNSNTYNPSGEYGWHMPKNYTAGGLVRNDVSWGDDYVGDWNFDFGQSGVEGNDPYSGTKGGRAMAVNRYQYMNTWSKNYIEKLNENRDPNSEEITYSNLNKEQHDEIMQKANNEWFSKLKQVYPKPKWAHRPKTEIQGKSGTNPYETISVASSGG